MKAQSFVTPVIVISVLVVTFMLLSKNPQGNLEQNNNQLNVATEESLKDLNVTPNPNMADLKIEDIKVGTGREVKSGDTVVMNYVGTLEDGTKFDSSYDRGQPFETQIGVGRVIQGWDQGVPGMKIGGKRKLVIPSDMAYGDQGIPGVIPGKATLIFEVELMDIKN